MFLMQLEKIIEKHGRDPEDLISILLDYQNTKEDNYISEGEVRVIAKELNLTTSRIDGVMTFYTLLSTKPRGKYVIQVCNDVPCYVNGSFNILSSLEELLAVKKGETTADGIFSIETTSCLGCCDKSPAIRIGSDLYGNLTKEKLAEIIADCRRK